MTYWKTLPYISMYLGEKLATPIDKFCTVYGRSV